MPASARRSRTLQAVALLAALATALPAAADRLATIERVKRSVVAIGTFDRLKNPPFQFLGTGFAVGDGTLVATNAHVVSALPEATRRTLAILLPAPQRDGKEQAQVRELRFVVSEAAADLALLKLSGAPLPALAIGDSERVREGQDVLLTGFPIGAVLGPYPATHRGIVAAVTPIAIPQARSTELDPATVRRLTTGSFPVFQLDATAYPGNSGSPVYDPESGEVLGVVNMVLVKGSRESALAQPSGISYAVPSRHLRALVEQAR